LLDRISDGFDCVGRRKAAPIAEGGPVRISVLQRLAFIVDLVGFFLPLNFSPGSCRRVEDFMMTLTINKDDTMIRVLVFLLLFSSFALPQ
jgi:hypothetical protein